MLFKRYHIYPMHIGMKIYTRRMWKKPMVSIGKWYDVTHKMMYSPEDVVGKIYVEGLYRQPLGMMTEKDAFMEGGYDRATYFKVLDEINKSPIPQTTSVWVVKFRFVLSDIISESELRNDYFMDWQSHMKAMGQDLPLQWRK